MAKSPAAVPGAAIRARRLELGLTLSEVSAATRIPLGHLEAIETERYEVLPAGPYASAYVRTLRDYLQVDDVDMSAVPHRVVSSTMPTAPMPTEPTDPAIVVVRGPSLAWIQRLALFSAMALIALVISVLVQRTNPLDRRPLGVAAQPQELTLEVRNRTRVRMVVDGSVEIDDGWLDHGYKQDVTWEQRVELHVQAVEDVVVTWNGRRVRPQGQQKAPRKLVFVDDRGAIASPLERAGVR